MRLIACASLLMRSSRRVSIIAFPFACFLYVNAKKVDRQPLPGGVCDRLPKSKFCEERGTTPAAWLA
ncbi:hypothetical protein GCM10007905_13020 [Mixta theicola]|nr:hypothetical protein GCM10007905_13020 [Mixta theicola]